jgi:hypothetical protein
MCKENRQIFKTMGLLQNELADTVQHLAEHMEYQLKNVCQQFVAINCNF